MKGGLLGQVLSLWVCEYCQSANCTYQLHKQQSADTVVIIGWYRSAKRLIIGRYRLSTDYRYISS